MIFTHHGDYGDIIYSLMAVKFLCAEAGTSCDFYLCPSKDTRVLMTPEHAENILPLLREQPYIAKAEWRERPIGVRIDTGQRRFERRGWNMADQYTHYLALPYSEQHGDWLTVRAPNLVAPVVFARSQRYRNPHFPWRSIHRRYAERSVFVGTQEEHADFESLVGKVPIVCTPTLLDVARVLAGAKLFIGNQSCPRAIAEGLKLPVCVEQFAPCANTHFGRGDAWYDIVPPENVL